MKPSEVEITTTALPAPTAPSATRRDVQLGRRLVHCANGCAIATAYALVFTHQQIVHTFGSIACLVYVLDRVRIHYPELMARAPWINRLLFRAEEEFKESAMTPYAIAILLTLLTFPKTIEEVNPSLRHIAGKSVEGSLAFFTATAIIAAVALRTTTIVATGTLAGVALAIGLAGAIFETLPLRLDDNLTIPLFVGFAGWAVCALAGITPP